MIVCSSTNIFQAVAKALWAQGEDGEVIARDMAFALAEVIQDGKGVDTNVTAEFTRLLNQEG